MPGLVGLRPGTPPGRDASGTGDVSGETMPAFVSMAFAPRRGAWRRPTRPGIHARTLTGRPNARHSRPGAAWGRRGPDPALCRAGNRAYQGRLRAAPPAGLAEPRSEPCGDPGRNCAGSAWGIALRALSGFTPPPAPPEASLPPPLGRRGGVSSDSRICFAPGNPQIARGLCAAVAETVTNTPSPSEGRGKRRLGRRGGRGEKNPPRNYQ
jgi:hypothetical protein